MNTQEIASVLSEVAVLLELRGENQFRVRAFQNAVRVLETTQKDAGAFVDEVKGGSVKGIGPALQEAIGTLYDTGELPLVDELKDGLPDGLFEILKVPGLGAKKVRKLYEALNIDSIESLKQACLNEEVSELKGFAKKTEQNILQGIEHIEKFSGQFLYSEAKAYADSLIEHLEDSGLTEEISIAGSLRRKKEIVKDVDILASSKKPKELMEAFVSYPLTNSVTSKGDTKSAIILDSGLSVDLRVVSKKEFPTALQHFTGSKEHNTELRSISKKKGYKLNEYGLFEGEKALPIKDEAAIYKKLGLKFTEPELRENTGELGKDNKKLPELVTSKDIKGILHAHSTYSDGKNTLREMAEACIEQGYEYLGITDHSQSAAYAGGLKPDRIKKQHAEIDKLNKELAPFKILKGIESDILKDGALDYTDKVLNSFDFIIASVHSRFSLGKEEMTERIIKAVSNPHTSILGHLTGRLLLERDSYEIDLEAVLEACAENNVAVEINAAPKRLELDWRYHKRAKELGIKIPICPDAHSIDAISYTDYGVGVARKGWLEKEDVLNTLSLSEIEEYFSK